MRWPWLKHTRHDWDVPDTGGRAARERAQRSLAKTRQETEKVRAETPHYEQLGEELRQIHAVRNHLALAFYTAARGKR